MDRGVVESTLASYGGYVGDLVRVLGDDPRMYTAVGLRGFVEQRCRHYVFVSRRRRKLAATTVRGVFGRLVRSIGLVVGTGQPRPRLDDLRFYFANQVLTNGPGHDTGISRHMVGLTTYLGHRDARSTETFRGDG